MPFILKPARTRQTIFPNCNPRLLSVEPASAELENYLRLQGFECSAYGWPATTTDAEILERLVALNAERAAEEKRGVIHWLRPEYRAKGQAEMVLPAREPTPAKKGKAIAAVPARAAKAKWPAKMAERVQLVEAALHQFGAPATPGDLAKQFKRAKPAYVAEILETLATLGRARKQNGKFTR